MKTMEQELIYNTGVALAELASLITLLKPEYKNTAVGGGSTA